MTRSLSLANRQVVRLYLSHLFRENKGCCNFATEDRGELKMRTLSPRLQKARLHMWVLTAWALPHTMLEADLVLLVGCSNFNVEVVDDGEGASGNELGGAAKTGRSSRAAPAEWSTRAASADRVKLRGSDGWNEWMAGMRSTGARWPLVSSRCIVCMPSIVGD
jgi:hypothetical protein